MNICTYTNLKYVLYFYTQIYTIILCCLKKHMIFIAWCLFQFVVVLLITYKCIHWLFANGKKNNFCIVVHNINVAWF